MRHDIQRQMRDQTGVAQPATAVGGWMRCGPQTALRDLRRGLDLLAHGGCERVYLPGLLRCPGPEQAGAVLERAGQTVQHAHRRGLEVGASLSECCDCRVAEAGTDHAAPGALLAAALRQDEAWQMLMDHMRHLRHELELDALYAEPALAGAAGDLAWALSPDGRTATASDAGSIEDLHDRRFALTAALQRLGYKCLLSGAGALGPPVQPLRGELPFGREFMLRDQLARFPYEDIVQAGLDALEAYFRGCAHRAGYAVVCDPRRRAESLPWWDERFAAVNRAFHAVREYMEQSSLLPRDNGILWTGPDPDVEVLWTFAEVEHPLPPGVEAFDVMESRRVKPRDGAFAARPLRAYLLQRTAGS